MFKHFPRWAHEKVASQALEALNGFGLNIVTNTDSDTFWYAGRDLKDRYVHEKAEVGDHFWDGNNGDKHTVVAVDLENNRIAYRNDYQHKELVEIAGW